MQVRVGRNGPYGVDFTAVLMMADAMGADTSLLADILPAIEPVIIRAYREASENGE